MRLEPSTLPLDELFACQHCAVVTMGPPAMVKVKLYVAAGRNTRAAAEDM